VFDDAQVRYRVWR